MGDEMRVNSVVYTVGVIYLLPAPALQIPPGLGTRGGEGEPCSSARGDGSLLRVRRLGFHTNHISFMHTGGLSISASDSS